MILELLFASKTLYSKASKNDKESAILPILELFGYKYRDIYRLNTEIKDTKKHKSCVICGLLERTYKQLFID